MMQEEAWARAANAEYALKARLLRGLHTSIFKLVQGRNWVQDKAIVVATTILDALSQSNVLGGAVSLVVGRHLLSYYTRVLPATAPATQAAHGHLRYLIQQDAEDF